MLWRLMKNLENYTMKELPPAERPYEKCLANGPAALSNAELLAVILRSGTREESAVQLALRLLSLYGSDHPLSDVLGSSIPELTEVRGIGEVKAVTLRCVGELSRRVSAERAVSGVRLTSPAAIADYYMEELRRLPQEEIRAAFFDTKSNFIRDCLISRGTVNASIVTPREVFLQALRCKAVYAVLVHNHPSGDPTPSQEDVRMTKRMAEAGRILQIPLMDHIVIGDRRYYSLKEHSML